MDKEPTVMGSKQELFLKYFVKLPCATICSGAFVLREFFDYCHNFISCYQSVQDFCFLFILFWKITFFYKFVPFTQVFNIFDIYLLIAFLTTSSFCSAVTLGSVSRHLGFE